MRTILSFALLLTLSSLFTVAAPIAGAATDLSVDEIINRANYRMYYQGQDGRARVQMEITDEQGRIRRRAFTILRRDEPETDALADNAYRGDQAFYVYFHRPADVAETVFMVRKHARGGTGSDAAGPDDRWLYLPALDLVKRIAPSDERTSFVGSDFFYEDVSGRGLHEDTHTLLRTTDTYYVVRNTPKQPEQVEFTYYDMYIHRETFIPVQVDYADAQGHIYRTGKALRVDTIQGYPTVTRSSMEDRERGSTTVQSYAAVEYDTGIPADIFTERYLRRAPRQYLR